MARPVTTKSSDFVPRSRAHLRLMDGGLAEPRRPTPKQELEQGLRELCVRFGKRSTNSHGYATPAIAAIAQGIRFPLRVIARLITGVLMAGGAVEFGEQLGYLIITFNAQEAARLNRRPPPRGDHRNDPGVAA